MKNKLTDDGQPICPVCSTTIRSGQGAVRSDDYVVHLTPCWDRTRYGDPPKPT